MLVRYEVSERGSTLVFENTRGTVVSGQVQLRAVSRPLESKARQNKNKIAMTMAKMLLCRGI